jgi:peptidoglycan/LPS O-acetylase OafA/YrhL
MPAVSWAVALGLFWIVAFRLGIPRAVIDYTPWQQMMRQLLYGLVGFFLLLPAVFGPQDRGAIRGLLRSRPFVLAGLISYGIYLWHNLWLEKVQDWTDTAPFTGHFPRVLATVVALTVVVATASYLLVEKPALRRKERRRPEPVRAS